MKRFALVVAALLTVVVLVGGAAFYVLGVMGDVSESLSSAEGSGAPPPMPEPAAPAPVGGLPPSPSQSTGGEIDVAVLPEPEPAAPVPEPAMPPPPDIVPYPKPISRPVPEPGTMGRDTGGDVVFPGGSEPDGRVFGGKPGGLGEFGGTGVAGPGSGGSDISGSDGEGPLYPNVYEPEPPPATDVGEAYPNVYEPQNPTEATGDWGTGTGGSAGTIDDEDVRASAAPPGPAETTIPRHPTIDAPDEVAAGETVDVSVGLTEELFTPEVTARAAPGGELTRDGALELALPALNEEWPIDIDLFAPGFDLADGGEWSRQVTLYKVGDSDFARFRLTARPTAQPRQRQFMVRLYHQGRFLGSASRPVSVVPERVANAPAADAPAFMIASAPAPEAITSTVSLDGDADVADLDVTILYDDPETLGAAQIVIHSPHLGGTVTDRFRSPPGLEDWLEQEYARLLKLGLQLRSAEPLVPQAPTDAAGQRRFVTLAAEGFGDALYRSYVPDAFKQAFWTLKHQGKLGAIQITSNSSLFPWELIRPVSPETAESDGFLGLTYRLARWAPRSLPSQIDNPLNRVVFDSVATVAPSYADAASLPYQRVELEALSKLRGYKLFNGDFLSFEKMVDEVSTGFVHFSGHGEVNQPGGGAPVFAIRLADQSLDPNTWRALQREAHRAAGPFYFFNACDTGRSQAFGGFVQGWGPAVLEGGATGFIGGMWPLTDRSAAAFSTSFYGGIASGLGAGPVYLADVLRDVRRQFYETGDPTYLAYTFYGNANLKVVAQ